MLPSKLFSRSRNIDVTKLGELDLRPHIKSQADKNRVNNMNNGGDGNISMVGAKFSIIRCRPDKQTVFTFHR